MASATAYLLARTNDIPAQVYATEETQVLSFYLQEKQLLYSSLSMKLKF